MHGHSAHGIARGGWGPKQADGTLCSQPDVPGKLSNPDLPLHCLYNKELQYMSCSLCGLSKPLVKSHIVPKSFYDLPSPGEEATKILSNTPGQHPRKSLTGVYSEGILCADCDAGTLGRLDQHATEHLLRGERRSIHRICFEYPNADPELITKFALSVLWRASLSSSPVFRRVKLGPYKERIKELLLSGHMSQATTVALVEFDETGLGLLDPHSTRFDGAMFWQLYASRFIFYVKMSGVTMPTFMQEFTLAKGRPVRSLVRKWRTSKEFGLARNIARANPKAFRPPRPR